MSIRTAIVNDLPEILAIYNDAILNTTAVYDYEPHTLAMRQAWFESKMNEGFPVYVAEMDRRVVGFAALGHFRAWAAYQFTTEHAIYVDTDYRGQGIGKQLLARLIDSAERMEKHIMIAGVDATNVASYRLHRHFGFEEVAHFKRVGYKFGRWLDLKFLQLQLPEPAKLGE